MNASLARLARTSLVLVLAASCGDDAPTGPDGGIGGSGGRPSGGSGGQSSGGGSGGASNGGSGGSGGAATAGGGQGGEGGGGGQAGGEGGQGGSAGGGSSGEGGAGGDDPDASVTDAGAIGVDSGCNDDDGDGVCNDEDACPGVNDTLHPLVPSSYWRLESVGGSGEVLDEAGSVDGTAVGSPTTGMGRAGSALVLDGTSQHVRFGDVLDPGTSSFSVQAWYRTTNGTATQKIIGKGLAVAGTPANAGFHLRLTGDATQLEFFIRDDTNPVFLSVAHDTLDTWEHVVGVVDRTNATSTIYVNGAQRGQLSIPGGFGDVDTDLPLAIGALDRGNLGAVGERFAGRVDEVAIFPTALDDCQVARAYAAGLRGEPLDLQ